MTEQKNRYLAAWLATMLLLAGIPALILHQSVVKYYALLEQEAQLLIRQNMQQNLGTIRMAHDQERYWASKLTDQFLEFGNKEAELEEIISYLDNEREKFNQIFNFVVWNTKGEIVKNNYPTPHSEDEWYQVFKIAVFNCQYDKMPKKYRPSGRDRSIDMDAVRRVLGPQYVPRMTKHNSHGKNLTFTWADSAGQTPPSWVFFTPTGGAKLFFDQEKLKQNVTARVILTNLSQKAHENYGLFYTAQSPAYVWPKQLTNDFPEIAQLLEKCSDEYLTFVESENHYLTTKFLAPRLRVFSFAPKSAKTDTQRNYATLAALLFLVLMIPLQVYTYKTIVKQEPGTLSIKARLAFLFLFATSVPFMAMYTISREHYAQKRRTLIRETHQRSINLLRNFDERMQSYISRIENKLLREINEWITLMPGRDIDEDTTRMVAERMTKVGSDLFFLVGSQSEMIGSVSGANRSQQDFDVARIREESGNQNLNAQLVNLSGRRILNELNNTPIEGQTIDQFEILIESVMQRSFAEMVHNFISASGGITPWGFGQGATLAMTNFMSLPGSTNIDYLVFAFWSLRVIERTYIHSVISDINRNSLGLKIYAREDANEEIIPSGLDATQQLENTIAGFTERPQDEIQTLEIDRQSYMLVGFNGNHLTQFKIIGLFPLSRLDFSIKEQQNEQLIFMLISLLLALWLAHLLTNSFIVPLQDLQRAALAIEKRDFTHRISNPENDEFGHIGHVFNDVMISLSELEVASAVQENLFPQSAAANQNFKVYGKSISMAELGGDYFDYYITADSNLAVLMGDVAGHGVGAALIMAMAKAAVIRCSHLQSQPLEMIKILHQLIYSSKTRKQKKIMTFQYLLCTDNRAIYCNAGGCSPIFYDHSKMKTHEVSLAGAALGAFKKGSWSELEIEFDHNDAMVLYTDGIIECHDKHGKELGYEGFADLVRTSWHPDPKEMYDRIYAGYLAYISGNEAEDDLTLVVISMQSE